MTPAIPVTVRDEEVLPIAPSNWYLAGFLVPFEAPASQKADDDEDDEAAPGRGGVGGLHWGR